MAQIETVVVLGGGLGGGAAARELRESGFDGALTLVGAEAHPPYERPPLSKEFLRGESDATAAYVEPEGFWAEHGVDMVRGRAVRLDLADGRVELDDGDRLPFDRLLLATGAEPRALGVPGAELDGVFTLRTLEDAETIRDRARRADRVLVIGGGWIGCEVAASLRSLGCGVTVALRGRLPLAGTLGPEVAAVYQQLHRDHGVDLRPETEVVAFEGDDRVQRARTSSGERVDCDLVVVAIGVQPRLHLAADAGLEVGDGVVVDSRLATSDPRVFAVGDLALVPWPVPGRRLRVEHWAAALAQGGHAARAALGSDRPYDGLPYFFSDQYDTGMEFWGDPAHPGELIVRGELGARSFNAFWHESGRVTAVMNMHVHHHHDAADEPHDPDRPDAHAHPDDHAAPDAHEHEHSDAPAAPKSPHSGGHLQPEEVEALLRARAPVDAAALADPTVPLSSLSRS